ncbi:MAG: cytochrome c biogenesis protein CcsA [Chloroflexi bacterium]|nr:cytochrome c biogenesis protein CcsA [Chloroflexota bacterium]
MVGNGTRNDRLLWWLTVLCMALMIAALYMALIYAPAPANVATEDQRFSQRIIYFHVPTAWIGFLAFLVTFVSSILYLARRERRWDTVAAASVELGVGFTTAVLITGSIWAKPAWNTWWTWDPRLTTSSITWVIYLAYLMLRAALDNSEQRARLSAVYGIAGFSSVPITFMAIRWWRTIHPVLLDSSGFGLSPNMMTSFFLALVAFTVLYITLMWHRIRLQQLSDEVQALRRRLLA